MKISIILPCYNEEENVRRIPQELMPVLSQLQMDYEIIIVDDGSSDNTVSAAESLGIPQLRIIKHETNKGLGAAVKTSFESLAPDSSFVVTLDADFTFHPRYIVDLLDRLGKGDVDLVVGSPKLAGYCSDIPSYRLLISKFANFVYLILFGKPVTAVSQILRIYKTEDVRNLKFDAVGFDVFAEILFKLLVIEKKRFAEIPANLTVREFGVSKLNYRREMIRHLKLLFKIIKWRVADFFAVKR